jgi:RNA-binding protein
LTAKQRAALKARAHALEPYVQVGHAGLSDAVVAEIHQALAVHELIKIRIGGADREARTTILDELCRRTNASLVQTVGRVAVLWCPRPEDESKA